MPILVQCPSSSKALPGLMPFAAQCPFQSDQPKANARRRITHVISSKLQSRTRDPNAEASNEETTKAKRRKGFYGIGCNMDVFATNAILKRRDAPILKKQTSLTLHW